ncbi:MAG TPA: cation-translocating P-type ATPase [Candidatus Eisenbacteria bacterium]|nr:cation-translocating P-type ATPase [Candidatus Eisenbacteria bacterium]
MLGSPPEPVDPQTLRGLSDAEASARLQADGPNELPRKERRSALSILLGILVEPMIALLVGVGVVYLLIGEPREATLLLASIGIVIAIDLVQEGKTERTLAALRDLSSPRALVIRDGQHRRIAGREVVLGDLVVIAEGDRVPADGVIVWTQHLLVDESLLTGEAVPVRKTAGSPDVAPMEPGGDGSPHVYSSTLVVAGQGIALVQATGPRTVVGRIGHSVATLAPEPSPLQREMHLLVRVVGSVALFVCVAAAVVYALRHGSWLEGVLVGLTFAISLVPEEFPVILTVLLALGAWRIAQRHVLTRRMPAIEALGATTVLCVDKTGTLTENRMTVRELRVGESVWTVDRSAADGLPETFHALVEFAVLASQRNPFDPMERAFHHLAYEWLRGTEHLHGNWALEREYPLSQRLLALSHVWSAPDARRYVIAAKGAPEAILDLCHAEPAWIANVRAAADVMGARGLRVLAVARAFFERRALPEDQHDFTFEFLGLVGLHDPVRAGVPDAVAECRGAGIRVVMLTGDHAMTARTIAGEVGLGTSLDVAVGTDLARTSAGELADVASRTSVFARIAPDQKLRLVEALASRGEVVAMTGDGVNDAPALKAAHVGIAMGGRGTDVAREAASLVLLDDAFGSIVDAVRLGRRIYDNLRKASTFVLVVHVAIAGIALVPVLFDWPLILFPVHVVFLELIIDPACSLVFEAEPEERGIMTRPPRRRDAPLLTSGILVIGVLQGIGLLSIVLAIFATATAYETGEKVARALAYTALVVGNLAVIATNQSWTRAAWLKSFWRNRTALAVATGASATLALILGVPWLRDVFGFGVPSAGALVVSALLAVASVAWVDVLRIDRRLV